jgi:hypothetical protein
MKMNENPENEESASASVNFRIFLPQWPLGLMVSSVPQTPQVGIWKSSITKSSRRTWDP